jgi:hypothetical protein
MIRINLEFDGEILFVIVWVLMVADYLWHGWQVRRKSTFDKMVRRARRSAMKRAS